MSGNGFSANSERKAEPFFRGSILRDGLLLRESRLRLRFEFIVPELIHPLAAAANSTAGAARLLRFVIVTGAGRGGIWVIVGFHNYRLKEHLPAGRRSAILVLH